MEDGASSDNKAAHGVEHFLVFGEASGFLFGKYHVAIDEHIELTGLTNDQFRLHIECIFNLGRETHGTRFVVSNVAILDFDLHGNLQAREWGCVLSSASGADENLAPCGVGW